jgi:hypothetical protein
VCAIGDVACEKYFYDVLPGDGKVEKALAELESNISVAYSKLVSVQDIGKLNLSERWCIAAFAVIQELRTKEWREALRDLCLQLKERLSKHELSEKLKKELQEVAKPEFHKEFQLKMLKGVPEYVEMLLCMKWILIENKTKVPFWTSDHPVSRHNPIDKWPLGNLGLLCEGIQIFLPLTPRIALCFCDLTHYFAYPERMATGNVDNVIFQNHLQLKWSTRSIFSCDANFSLATKILKEQPEWRNMNRKRFSVS